jgi:hypothetical protein
MAAIEETDPDMIQELLDECIKDNAKLTWALAWRQRYQENPHDPA